MLLINPVGSDSVVAAIEAANEADVPVFTIDRSASGGEVVSHIASDNLAGGKMAGDYLAESLGKTGKIVELQGIPGTSAAEARGAGFNEAMEAYPDMELIAQETANFDRAEGQTVFAAILEEQDEIDGVFAHNDEMMGRYDEGSRSRGRDQFVGFDAVEDAITALEAGDLLATVAQQPAEMGRLGKAAVSYPEWRGVDDCPVDLALIQVILSPVGGNHAIKVFNWTTNRARLRADGRAGAGGQRHGPVLHALGRRHHQRHARRRGPVGKRGRSPD